MGGCAGDAEGLCEEGRQEQAGLQGEQGARIGESRVEEVDWVISRWKYQYLGKYGTKTCLSCTVLDDQRTAAWW
jgi:hypothetical protein